VPPLPGCSSTRPLTDASADSLHAFITDHVEPGSTVITDACVPVGVVLVRAASFMVMSACSGVGGPDTSVAEPEGDHGGVDAGLQQRRGAAVAQDVWVDLLVLQR